MNHEVEEIYSYDMGFLMGHPMASFPHYIPHSLFLRRHSYKLMVDCAALLQCIAEQGKSAVEHRANFQTH